MIRKLADVPAGVLAYEASGRLTREDVLVVQQDLQRDDDAAGRRLLIDITQMDGAGVDAVWQDVKGALTYVRHVDRMAVIGDQRWQHWITRASDVVPGIDARFFKPDQRIEARSWLGAG
jgi:hypothetical protein